MLKRGQPSLYKLKEGRVNEECSCEQEHLLHEWTCSIGKLIKWVTLASHLLSLLDTACRFVMLLPAEWPGFTSCSADINERSFRWNSSCILHGVGRSCKNMWVGMSLQTPTASATIMNSSSIFEDGMFMSYLWYIGFLPIVVIPDHGAKEVSPWND